MPHATPTTTSTLTDNHTISACHPNFFLQPPSALTHHLSHQLALSAGWTSSLLLLPRSLHCSPHLEVRNCSPKFQLSSPAFLSQLPLPLPRVYIHCEAFKALKLCPEGLSAPFPMAPTLALSLHHPTASHLGTLPRLTLCS